MSVNVSDAMHTVHTVPLPGINSGNGLQGTLEGLYTVTMAAMQDQKITMFDAFMSGGVLILFGLLIEALYRSYITWRAKSPVPFISRIAAEYVRAYSFDDETFFSCDGADENVAQTRRSALDQLEKRFQKMHPNGLQGEDAMLKGLSDMRFTDMNRVPPPFQEMLRSRLRVASVVVESKGINLKDIEGQWSQDVSGAYGVNVVGWEFYKGCIERGWEKVKKLGPVLGPIHPIVTENVEMLKNVSGMDEVSFHMSGTEAVMCAVRLARFNTKRKTIVQFNGAYHGWWDGVQPGPGNTRASRDILTLKDMNKSSLAAIAVNANDIAGVIVSPYQAFHPNAPPPSDLVLLTKEARQAGQADRVRIGSTADPEDLYGKWLHELRQVCTANKVPLIFDEVYSGFRLGGVKGAQKYFNVQADMVVYGKTLGGGMPCGVVCGKKQYMNRFDDRFAIRKAYVIGTFSASPPVMGAMNEFLKWALDDDTPKIYEDAQTRVDEFIEALNKDFVDRSLPLRAVNLGTVWTVKFTCPSRYHWLYQYYLRAEGLSLAWVGTGRCIFSLDWTQNELDILRRKVLRAADQMREGMWWHQAKDLQRTILTRTVKENVIATVYQPLYEFYHAIMEQKEVDHFASHSHLINQFLHLISSSVFIYCYIRLFQYGFSDYATIMKLSTTSLFVRQAGHYIFEPPCHDKEAIMMGFDTRKKCMIIAAYCIIPFFNYPLAWINKNTEWNFSMGTIDMLIVFTIATVFGRVIYLFREYSVAVGCHWFIKFMTDPFTDLPAYKSASYRIFNHVLVYDAIAKSFPTFFPNHVPLPDALCDDSSFAAQKARERKAWAKAEAELKKRQ